MKAVLLTLTLLFPLSLLSADAPRAAILILDRIALNEADYANKFEDFLTQEFANSTLRIVSSELLLHSLSTAKGEDAQDYESILKDSSTLQQFASNNQLDYLLVVTLSAYSQEDKNIQAYNNNLTQTEVTLRGSWKLLSATDMGTEAAGRFDTSRAIQNNKNIKIEVSSYFPELLEKAANKIGQQYSEKAAVIAELKPANKEATEVEFRINSVISEFEIPDFILNDNGQYEATKYNVKLSPQQLTVEVNGIAIGSTGNKLETTPGIQNIRISGPDVKPWQRMVNIREGFELSVSLRLTEEAQKNWQEQIDFIESLKDSKRLTDAEIEQIQGLAQMLRQSGYKIDTDEAPQITIENKSVFSETKDL